MKYDFLKLPDFYSVRDFSQIEYSFEGMEGMKCYCFFDNGFTSNIINGNNRDMRFIWDGFILFVDRSISLEDIRNETDLYNARLVALQRTDLQGKKFNSMEVRDYIINKLQAEDIPYEIRPDFKTVDGYPSKCDLWSTRDSSVLIDAIDCVGEGDAYFFKDVGFNYEITFNESHLPSFLYSHLGAVVLKGKNSTAISRLIVNNQNLCDYLEKVIGGKKLYSYIEGRELLGSSISKIESCFKK